MSYRPDRLRRALATALPAAAAKPKKKRVPAAWRLITPLPCSTWQDDTLKIVLHIPPYEISPNGRPHWRTASKLKKMAKMIAGLTTLQLLGGKIAPCPVGYSLAYYWPSTHRDDDNAIGSVKAYMDGICEALGIDDKNIRFRTLSHARDTQQPRVEISMHLHGELPRNPR